MASLFRILLICLALLPPLSARALDESDQPLVLSITISGNESISGGELKDLMRSREPRFFQLFGHPRYVRDWLRSDLAVIEAYYHQKGFFEVQVSSLREEDVVYDPEMDGVHIRIHVREGKRRYLRRVIFTHSLTKEGPVRSEQDLRKSLRLQPGESFDPQAPGIDVYSILQAMQNRGYFSARVRWQKHLRETAAHAASDSLDIEFLLEPGPIARLGHLRFEGCDLPLILVRRELNLKEGEFLRLGDILASKQNLYDSGYFRLVNFRIIQREPLPEDPAAAPAEETLDLLWIFSARKMAALETGVGLGSEDGLHLLGGWSHRNLFNRGQRLGLNGKVSFKDNDNGQFGRSYERQSIEYSFLRVARLKAYLSLLLFRERDFESTTIASIETRAIRLSAARRLDPFSILRLREQFDFLYQRDLDSSEVPRSNTRSFTLIIDRDSRNDYFNPSRGSRTRFSYEIAGGPQGGDHDFHRFQCSISRHKGITSGVLAHRLYVGTVQAYGLSRSNAGPSLPDGVPFEERLYCGGGNTVRSYKDNSLGPLIEDEGVLNPGAPGLSVPETAKGGRFMMVANLEWRFPFSLLGREHFGGVFFLDAGNTWQSLDEINIAGVFPWQLGSKDDRTRVFYGMGLGFRYLTPLTIVRVDFAVPLQNVENTTGRWHLSLGHTF